MTAGAGRRHGPGAAPDGWGRLRVLLLTGLASAVAGCSWFARPSGPPVAVVPRVNLARYAGTWYEIAKYPNRFQEGCVGTTATYTPAPGGREIVVENRCREGTLDGAEKSIRGTARVVDAETNAKLKVTFFWPFSGDYWIIGLGEAYEYALVGTPNRRYLWILSRSPEMDETTYARLADLARAQGFDPARLTRTPQRGAAHGTAPAGAGQALPAAEGPPASR